MPDPYPLLQLLTARGPVSEAEAARALALGPHELRTLCETAHARGAPLERRDGLLWLTRPVTLFDGPALAASIHALAPGGMHELILLTEVTSTNTYLIGKARAGLPDGVVCLAEYQTAGRGRRGRAWLGGYGCSVLVSIHWGFSPGSRLEGLSLAVGVGVARALKAQGAHGIGLKWPNDVHAQGRKVAGILIESGQRSGGGWYSVSGIGINVLTPERLSTEIDQPWVALDELVGRPVARQVVAASVIANVVRVIETYARDGLGAMRAEWNALDVSADRPVSVDAGGEVIHGIGRGIDDRGGFRVESAGVTRTFHSAEVSVRLAARETARDGARPMGDRT